MSMKAQVRTDAFGNITILMQGGLDYSSGLPLRQELENMIQDNPSATITLDLNSLDFVGSSGIGLFVETLKILNEKKQQIMVSNVKSEFLKVFKLFEIDIMDFMAQEFETDETQNLSQHFAGKRKTFQN